MNTQQTNQPDSSYHSLMNEYFPARKSKNHLLAIVITILIVVAGIGWLFYSSNSNAEKLKEIQEKLLVQQEEAARIQQKEQAETLKKEKILKEQEAKNLNYRKNWERFITFENSKPTIDYTWGGVSTFAVTLTNNTDCILDQVDVSVKYIRKNGEIWQNSIVSYFNIAGGTLERKMAPASVNGVEVKLAIEKVISKKLNLCYPAGSGYADDPFYCK